MIIKSHPKSKIVYAQVGSNFEKNHLSGDSNEFIILQVEFFEQAKRYLVEYVERQNYIPKDI